MEHICQIEPGTSEIAEIREPIVRCRDCKYFNNYHGKCHREALVVFDDGTTAWIDNTRDWWGEIGLIAVTHAEPDGFCKWGEKK